MRKKMVVLFFIFLMAINVFAKKLTVLSELKQPSSVVVANNKLYVVDNFEVYIYSLEDYKLIKKFGSKGEGPKEFKENPLLSMYKDKLILNSMGRLSFYKEDGTFIFEKRTPMFLGGGVSYFPFKENYVGDGVLFEKGKMYLAVSFFDKNFKRTKLLGKVGFPLPGKKKMKFMPDAILFVPHNNKVYMAKNKEFSIDILNDKGVQLFNIKNKDFKRVKISKKYIREYEAYMKKSMPEAGFKLFKDKFEYEEHFPVIKNMSASKDRLYVDIYGENINDLQFYIYDLNGNFIKKSNITVNKESLFENYFSPHCVGDNNKLYKLVENDKEYWELYEYEI